MMMRANHLWCGAPLNKRPLLQRHQWWPTKETPTTKRQPHHHRRRRQRRLEPQKRCQRASCPVLCSLAERVKMNHVEMLKACTIMLQCNQAHRAIKIGGRGPPRGVAIRTTGSMDERIHPLRQTIRWWLLYSPMLLMMMVSYNNEVSMDGAQPSTYDSDTLVWYEFITGSHVKRWWLAFLCWSVAVFVASMVLLIAWLSDGTHKGSGLSDLAWSCFALFLLPSVLFLLGPLSFLLQHFVLKRHGALFEEIKPATCRFRFRPLRYSIFVGWLSYLIPSPFPLIHQQWDLVLLAATRSGDVDSLAAFSHVLMTITVCFVGVWASSRSTLAISVFNIVLVFIRQLLQHSAVHSDNGTEADDHCSALLIQEPAEEIADDEAAQASSPQEAGNTSNLFAGVRARIKTAGLRSTLEQAYEFSGTKSGTHATSLANGALNLFMFGYILRDEFTSDALTSTTRDILGLSTVHDLWLAILTVLAVSLTLHAAALTNHYRLRGRYPSSSDPNFRRTGLVKSLLVVMKLQIASTGIFCSCSPSGKLFCGSNDSAVYRATISCLTVLSTAILSLMTFADVQPEIASLRALQQSVVRPRLLLWSYRVSSWSILASIVYLTIASVFTQDLLSGDVCSFDASDPLATSAITQSGLSTWLSLAVVFAIGHNNEIKAELERAQQTGGDDGVSGWHAVRAIATPTTLVLGVVVVSAYGQCLGAWLPWWRSTLLYTGAECLIYISPVCVLMVIPHQAISHARFRLAAGVGAGAVLILCACAFSVAVYLKAGVRVSGDIDQADSDAAAFFLTVLLYMTQIMMSPRLCLRPTSTTVQHRQRESACIEATADHCVGGEDQYDELDVDDAEDGSSENDARHTIIEHKHSGRWVKFAAATMLLLGVLSGVVPLLVSPDAEADNKALGELFDATGGAAKWVKRGNWGASRLSMCAWGGVQCNGPPLLGRHHATKLLLGSNGLSGPIPPSIGCLTSLTSLDLSGNDLTGSVPAAIGSLTSLRILDLSANHRMHGVLPESLCHMPALEYLGVSVCNHVLPDCLIKNAILLVR